MRAPLTREEVSEALDKLYAIDAMAEIARFAALYMEEMEPTHPRFNRAISSFAKYMEVMGRLGDPALGILDEIEADLRNQRTQS